MNSLLQPGFEVPMAQNQESSTWNPESSKWSPESSLPRATEEHGSETIKSDDNLTTEN